METICSRPFVLTQYQLRNRSSDFREMRGRSYLEKVVKAA